MAVINKGEVSTRARKGLGRGLSEWQLLRAGWELLCESRLAKAIVVKRSGG